MGHVHGRLTVFTDIGKDDFVLEEDGHPQSIRYFAQEANLPLTLGLLVDTSLSQRNVLDQERTASKSFLDQMLTAANDQAFLIHFDREVELLQDLTSSRDKLRSALELLRTPTYDRDSGTGGGSAPNSSPRNRGRMRGGGTQLYDAVFLASNELMKKQQGRKALIILSDGVDRGSKLSLQSAIDTAQRADTSVYAILFKDDESHDNRGFGHGGYGGGMGRHGGMGGPRYPQEARPDGKKILEQITKETGGRLFEVSKKQPLEKIYDAIAEDLRNQYSLGYTPDPAGAEGSYHKISLKTKEKDLTVQARDGYYVNR